MPALSPATQDVLRPFFIQPMYEGSWVWLRFHPPGSSAADQASANPPARTAPSLWGLLAFSPSVMTAAQEPPPIRPPCKLAPSNLFDVKVTPHATIRYPSEIYGAVAHLGGQLTAEIVARYVEEIWQAETNFFGLPIADTDVACNGGDGSLDITIVDDFTWIAGHTVEDLTKALTVPYRTGCGPTPAHMLIRAVTTGFPADEKNIRDTLAHEIFHTISFGYEHSTPCQDFTWLDEATANWAIDFVYHDDQGEQPFAMGYMYFERASPLDEGFDNNVGQTNGYCDYVFLQYIAGTFGNTAIREIWDATKTADSIGALGAALSSRGGLADVWHRFALAAWNDYQAGIQKDLFGFDKLTAGVKAALEKPHEFPQTDGPTEVTLEGAQDRSFQLLKSAIILGEANQVERLSFDYDDLKFTDDSVRFVVYQAPLVTGAAADFNITALLKINGQWQGPQDWTDVGFAKTFCRDMQDQHIEELVLAYSNGNPNRPADPAVIDSVPMLSVSNVGCSRWTGTSRVTITDRSGGVREASATVTFAGPVEGTEGLFFAKFFQPVSGTVTIRGSNVADGACTMDIVPNSKALSKSDTVDDGTFTIYYTAPAAPDERGHAFGKGESTIPNTTTILRCPGQPAVSHTMDYLAAWMVFDFELPAKGAAASSDGQSIVGTTSWTDPDTGDVTVAEWSLHAEKE
jgi:hypothetical protein